MKFPNVLRRHLGRVSKEKNLPSLGVSMWILSPRFRRKANLSLARKSPRTENGFPEPEIGFLIYITSSSPFREEIPIKELIFNFIKCYLPMKRIDESSVSSREIVAFVVDRKEKNTAKFIGSDTIIWRLWRQFFRGKKFLKRTSTRERKREKYL